MLIGHVVEGHCPFESECAGGTRSVAPVPYGEVVDGVTDCQTQCDIVFRFDQQLRRSNTGEIRDAHLARAERDVAVGADVQRGVADVLKAHRKRQRDLVVVVVPGARQ